MLHAIGIFYSDIQWRILMTIKVVVATHKKYQMPDDSMYLPIQVGKSLKKDDFYLGDNTGENISYKNPNYCELTALYWAWRNLEADYIGLVHYRRHFCNMSHFSSFKQGSFDNILSSEKAEKLLKNYDCIVPKKRHYWIETLYSHYEHTHYIADLDKTREVISRVYPDYLNSFDKVMKRRSAHMFNMFITKRDILDSYLSWLFHILFKLEEEIDISNYSPYEARIFGYISELLFDVWLDHSKIKYIELPVMFMDEQNWSRKIRDFIINKYSKRHPKQLNDDKENEKELKSVQSASVRVVEKRLY